MKKLRFIVLGISLLVGSHTFASDRYNFNSGWLVKVGKDVPHASSSRCEDADWQQVTLPYSFNQHEAFAKAIDQLTDTIAWYRKHFVLPENMRNAKKFFIEFEGVRFGARCFLNGKELGWSDNGVMAFGFDLTPYIKRNGENVLAIRCDNNWRYKEHFKTWSEKVQKEVRSGFQWNDRNFYCNYGGINKNVWLHVMQSDVYQTLPLYSNLQTTGVYVYATQYDVKGHTAVINAESEVKNESDKAQKISYKVLVSLRGGKQIAGFTGQTVTVEPGKTAVCRASQKVSGLHFWSWGYGFLYDVKTQLLVDGKVIDETTTTTGFRKTDFKDGIVWLNDRALQLKGFAQRSTNEWPAVGISIPAWMSDYSNRLVLGCNGNFYRWMHVTPMKQDVESFDRLGLIQAMPAGDAEKDVNDRRWQQRTEVMRDAIIYNRNNPSILFYESGNNQISEEHMQEMKKIRDQYDPNGGRAIGSRNMLDSKEAEYGGEMLYINKSAGKPMWQMEYCRDEGIRKYWAEWSYPYHKEGDGPLFRGARAVSYNHNQDGLAVENVIRWNEYFLARPGQGRRANSGGAKIIFSDSNTHYRGEKNYRTSGDVDAMRIAKDSYFAHEVMWDGWVDVEKDHTYIVGHWNYERQRVGDGTSGMKDVVKPVYVVSTGDEVELLLNGKSLGKGKQSNTFLFTFENVKFQAGKLEAISRKGGKEVSRYTLETAGKPAALKMHWIEAPQTFRADGADIRMAEIEVVDNQGRRCPLANDMVTFSISGPAEWLGGISGDVADSLDNRVLSKELPVEAGVCRVMLRSTTSAGNIQLTAQAKGFKASQLSIATTAVPVKDGFYVDANGKAIEAAWQNELPVDLSRGETPATPAYRQTCRDVAVRSVEAGSHPENVMSICDDNEATKWTSDGHLDKAWVSCRLERPAAISKIVLRMDQFRKTSYPIEISTADGTVVWSGYTDKSLGYCYAHIEKPVKSDTYKIRMLGPATVKEAFGDMTELAAKQNVSTKASKSNRLSIIEIEFIEGK